MIIASAIWHEGHLLTGKRHCDCIKVAAILVAHGIGRLPITGQQGFLTDDKRFISRNAAAIHAITCGQIKELKFSSTELFSEDLW